MLTRLRPRHDDEAGASLIIAVIVMTMLATLTMALQVRTLSTLKSMRSGQDYEAALAIADAGLADAVYKIEQTTPSTFTSGGAVTYGGGSYEYKASRQDQTTYFVYARGELRGTRHGVTARVQRSSLFPYALFGYEALSLNGSSIPGGQLQLYVVGSPGAPVQVGSNGQVTCNGTQVSNLVFRSFGGFSGCPSTQWSALQDRHVQVDIEPPPPTSRPASQQCTAQGTGVSGVSGVFSGVVDGGGGDPYICRENVTFSGVVSVSNGPLIVYVLNKSPGTDPRAQPTGHCPTLDLGLAVVNAGQPARNVQIYKDGACGLNMGNGNTADQITFSGVLYAPKETLTINGGKWFTGSINVANVVMNGNPNLVIGYDGDLSTYYGKKWRVSRYAEVPSNSLPCLTCIP